MGRRDMVRKSFLGLLLTRLLCLAYGDSPIRTAESGEFPFQVFIRDLKKNNYLCSGVLITNRTVLTPASCVPPDTLVKISAGSIYRTDGNRTTNFKEIIIHSQYNSTEMTNDIALIRVADPFKMDESVAAATIPRKGTTLANKTSLTGWNVVDPDSAMKVYENYTLWRECKTRYDLELDLAPDEICGDYIFGPDHGSPISKNGIVYGLQTESPKKLRMHSFVEISVHEDWIRSNLGMEAIEVKWHGTNRNEAGSRSNCMAAMLLFAVFLCQ